MNKGILIIGNRNDAARLQEQLEKIGYVVECLLSESEEAIARVRQFAPNLVLVDLTTRGSEERLRLGSGIANQLEVPWMCFTPSRKNPSIRAARKLGSHGYISGDLDGETFSSSIKKAIHKRQREKALDHKIGWLVKAISGLSDAVFVTDPEGRIVFMNRKAEAISGMSTGECNILSFDDGVSIGPLPKNGTRQAVVQSVTNKLHGVSPDHRFCYRSSTEGKEIPGQLSISPIEDSSSKLIGFFLIVKLGEGNEPIDAIVRAKREWERSMDSVPELVAVVNPRKKMTRLNMAMAQALVSTPRDSVGRSCCPLFRGTDRKHVCLHDETMRDGKVRSQEVFSEKLGGTYLLRVAPYCDSAGRPIGTVHIATDITEMKKSQDEVQDSRDRLLKKCGELELALLDQQQQLSESQHRDRYFSEGLLNHMEAIRMLVLSSERKKREAEQNFLKKLEISVKPLIMQLRVQRLPEISQALVKALEYHVSQMCGQSQPDSRNIWELLTLRENQICDMILSGLSSKEIAEVLNVSDHTVLCHRVRIRKKLGLGARRPSLLEFLQAKKSSDEIA